MSCRVHNQHLPKQKNSWYLRTGQVHHFLCQCGQVEQFANIVTTIHHPGHQCSACGNTHYLDSEMFLYKEKVTMWSNIYWNIDKLKTDEFWIISAYVNIPVFDYGIQKIRIKKIVLATSSLSFRGKYTYTEDQPVLLKKYVYNHSQTAKVISEMVKYEIDDVLSTFVLASPIEKLEWMKEETIPEDTSESRLQLYTFFLRHSHLKAYDFFYWKHFDIFKEASKIYPSLEEMLHYVLNFRNEKSLKKALYISYEKSMQKYASYDPLADYIFSRKIEDRNFLLQLIKLPIKIKASLFQGIQQNDITAFFNFLKEHYTQKAISGLFVEINSGYHLRDTIQMLRADEDNFIAEHFRKVPLNIDNLHDEFIRVGRLRKRTRRGTRIFTYHDNNLEAETNRNPFEYRLPSTEHALQEWANLLHNCMYGYADAIHKSHSIIYGVFKEERLCYAIEIRRHKIVQALGKYNKRIDAEDIVEIDEWFREVYRKAWINPTQNKKA